MTVGLEGQCFSHAPDIIAMEQRIDTQPSFHRKPSLIRATLMCKQTNDASLSGTTRSL